MTFKDDIFRSYFDQETMLFPNNGRPFVVKQERWMILLEALEVILWQ